jgi:type IV pilus assembly protein PilE
MPRVSAGFTLLELMIVAVVIAILASIAYPSFVSQIRKGRRADAINVMSQVQQAQERWRANNQNYTDLAGLGLAGTTPGGYYAVTTAAGAGAEAARDYTVTATAQGSQTADTDCAALRIAVDNGAVAYLAGTTSASLNDAAGNETARRCWNR